MQIKHLRKTLVRTGGKERERSKQSNCEPSTDKELREEGKDQKPQSFHGWVELAWLLEVDSGDTDANWRSTPERTARSASD